MALSETILFKNSAIHWEAARFREIPEHTRGIYILFNQNNKHMNVAYVGIAVKSRSGIRSRIYTHSRKKKFTHFSFYEVWDNISEKQIMELEGLILHIYATDEHANSLNKSKSYMPLANTKRSSLDEWIGSPPVVKSKSRTSPHRVRKQKS